MKARGVQKNFHEIIARNVEGGGGGFPPPDLLGLIQPMSTEHSPDLLELQSDLGYPATSGPAPIHISNLPGYVRYAKNTASSVRCIHVHVIMYLLIDTVFVLFLSIFYIKWTYNEINHKFNHFVFVLSKILSAN